MMTGDFPRKSPMNENDAIVWKNCIVASGNNAEFSTCFRPGT